MARFPHIGGAEKFPYLERAKPFERTTDFDYTRYDYTATAKLCSVPWPIDYRHTVAWEDAEARDDYFEGLDGHTLELAQGFTHIQLDRIRLDVPYDEALTYNYVYMQVPRLTEDAPIRYEGSGGMRTICAFIEDCIYYSPSTTEFMLSLDMWTTYLPYLAIDGLMLRRGHAPMYKTDAAAYLADPVSNCTDLLTPDVNFGGGADVTRFGEAKPLSTAEPFYVFASTIPYSDIATLAQATVTTATAPTFSDTSARNGHQLTVGGYAWNTRGASNLYNPTKTVSCADGSTPSGLYYYGVYASAMSSGAFESLFSTYPLLAKTTKALYVVPSDLVTRGTEHTVSTFTFYEVQSKPGMQSLGSFTLTKTMFGYATEYADIAKLYTSPYASLELADDLGNVVPLRVENCHSTLDISQHLNMAWPFLSWDAMITNYASTTAANATYNWRKLNDGTTEARSVPNADFIETAIAFGIDTYELRLEAWPLAQIDSYYDADYQREAAINAYQATMRSANTGLENAEDSNATANTNALASNTTANTNALESNTTANTNAHNSNDTAQHNSQASAYVTHVNAYRSADNGYDMADYQAGSNSRLATINTDSNDTLQTLSEVSMQEMHSNKEIYEATMFNLGTQAQQLRDITSAVPSFLSGDVPGLALSAMSSLVNLSLAQSQYETTKTYNIYREDDTIAANRRGTNAQNSRVSLTTSEQNTTTRYIALNNRNTARLNADDIKTVTNDNAVRSQTAGNANADRTKTTADANANRTKTTADANANRTKTTADANAGYSRATTEENAKAALLLAQDAYTLSIEGAGVENPAAFGSAAGDGLANSYRMRNVHLRAKTQTESAIARAGDAFLRYGYAYDGIWDVTSWCPTGHDFCYWQADDLWLSSADIANPQAERALETILDAGTTVWADPDKIGRVRI